MASRSLIHEHGLINHNGGKHIDRTLRIFTFSFGSMYERVWSRSRRLLPCLRGRCEVSTIKSHSSLLNRSDTHLVRVSIL